MKKIVDILNTTFYSNDLSRAVTVKEFFIELLKRLFNEQENFSAKRPFGNSDWTGDLIVCFIKNGIIDGKLDCMGYINDFDYQQFNECVQLLIEHL